MSGRRECFLCYVCKRPVRSTTLLGTNPSSMSRKYSVQCHGLEETFEISERELFAIEVEMQEYYVFKPKWIGDMYDG